jgi:exosortase A-associated hydrolase 1
LSLRTVTVECAGDHLTGILHEPSGPARTGILIVTGGPQYRVGSHRQFVQMARVLEREGFAVLRFDCRGMGDSSGTHPGFEAMDQDIAAARKMLLAEVPSIEHVIGLGLCDAATALLLYCDSQGGFDGLVLINPWVRTEAGHASANLKHYYATRFTQGAFWRKLLTGGVDFVGAVRGVGSNLRRVLKPAGGPVSGPEQFLRRMESGASKFRGAMLFLSSEFDLTAREFESECQRSKTWQKVLSRSNVCVLPVPRADHTFSAAESLADASAGIVSWATRMGFRGPSHDSGPG